MKILLASDIFGDTPELHTIAHAICGNCSVVSPYEGRGQRFNGEEQAYASFLSHGGIHLYAEKLARQINSYQPDAVVGFSAGATAGWLALSENTGHAVELGVLFYGSRIRDHLYLRPRCATKLYFAEHEQSFDPKQLVVTLRTSGLSAEICSGCLHGFMNPLSTGHDSSAERMGIGLIKSALHELTNTRVIHSITPT